jgi:hypothetical protein
MMQHHRIMSWQQDILMSWIASRQRGYFSQQAFNTNERCSSFGMRMSASIFQPLLLTPHPQTHTHTHTHTHINTLLL